jgi:hypothetical protein
VQDNTQQGSVDMQPAIILNEAQFPEFIIFMNKLTRERVAPIISASISCVILESIFCGWASWP